MLSAAGGVAERVWDVIVIGTGMGGGTAGRALAEAGLSVLFVEKGHAAGPEGARGLQPGGDPAVRLRRGAWPGRVRARVNGVERVFHAPLGCTVGGSSVYYAATLERPERHDLDDLPEMPHPAGGWPVSFAAMEPWFARAEALYAVRGQPDPLSGAGAESLGPPLPLAAGEVALAAQLQRRGLHPYGLHMALRDVAGCAGCFGGTCARACKMEGQSAGVAPALATGRAVLLEGCAVTRFCGDAGGVTHLEAVAGGERVVLRGRAFVLAAGALASPRLLLASASEVWPAGPGNGGGMVGRNLMFHLSEMVAIWPARGTPAMAGPTRGIGFRDLYRAGEARFGMVQAMGVAADRGMILHFLRQAVARSRYGRVPGLASGLRQAVRLPATVAARLLGEAQVFVGLVEDLPYEGNRVLWEAADGDDIRLEYRIRPELEARLRAFRRLLRQRLRGQRHLLLTRWPELNFGHACGTLRMGHDPGRSVVDAECRVHGAGNLYVADAGVFPSSMGVNPSLTIAANALRVADAVVRRMAAGGHP